MHAGKSVNSLQLAVKRRTRFVSPRNISILSHAMSRMICVPSDPLMALCACLTGSWWTMADCARVGLEATNVSLEEAPGAGREARRSAVDGMRQRLTAAFPGLSAELAAMEDSSCAVM